MCLGWSSRRVAAAIDHDEVRLSPACPSARRKSRPVGETPVFKVEKNCVGLELAQAFFHRVTQRRCEGHLLNYWRLTLACMPMVAASAPLPGKPILGFDAVHEAVSSGWRGLLRSNLVRVGFRERTTPVSLRSKPMASYRRPALRHRRRGNHRNLRRTKILTKLRHLHS